MYNEFLNGVTVLMDKKTGIHTLLHFSFIIISILLVSTMSLSAGETSSRKGEPGRAMFGIAGTGGLFSAIHLRGSDEGGEPEWKPGYGFGGGFVFDYMFSESTGLHSGLYYYYTMLT